MRLIRRGKVKDVYEYDGEHLLLKFSDRVSAYDVEFPQPVPEKGRVLCMFAEYWFERLGVASHFVRRVSDTETLVKKLEMIPMECVIRGYFYGSLVARWSGERPALASRLERPVFDPTTKSKHDTPVGRAEAASMQLCDPAMFDELAAHSARIYETMSGIVEGAGFILADLKLEFGTLDGRVLLGDSIGPDEYRLWPRSTYRAGRRQESFDKQILRDWLAENGHADGFERDRRAGRAPAPPEIPTRILELMTERYLESYELLTGRRI